jgi:hypothetical protein
MMTHGLLRVFTAIQSSVAQTIHYNLGDLKTVIRKRVNFRGSLQPRVSREMSARLSKRSLTGTQRQTQGAKEDRNVLRLACPAFSSMLFVRDARASSESSTRTGLQHPEW